MKKIICIILTVMMTLSFAACGDGAAGPGSSNDFGEYTLVKAEAPSLDVSAYDGGGIFNMDLPKGWVVSTVGEYTGFGLCAYDPENPERKIFYYSKMEPILKSSAQKNTYKNMASMVQEHDAYGYHAFSELPVMKPTTVGFLKVYNKLLKVADKYPEFYPTHKYPDMHNIKVLETFNNSTPQGSNCLDNKIARVTFKSDNDNSCEGLIAGQVVNKITDWNSVPGVDMGFYCVYSFMGVTAEAAEFDGLEETMLKCLSSFTFTEEYLAESKQKTAEQTEQILAQNREMQAAYDSYNAAWSSRQTKYDIISQKTSDATLGYDRLYDPDTGEIYRAEVGFYDSYDINREDYSKSNLQIIDDSTKDYYLKDVDYYLQN